MVDFPHFFDEVGGILRRLEEKCLIRSAVVDMRPFLQTRLVSLHAVLRLERVHVKPRMSAHSPFRPHATARDSKLPLSHGWLPRQLTCRKTGSSWK
ncbi:hypothetical protein X961_5424 [Burkholderia pseudomallei MSHR5613]|nr:hypothetical protein X961_5424 [Burkholderia pseudomallei MSHR5613]